MVDKSDCLGKHAQAEALTAATDGELVVSYEPDAVFDGDESSRGQLFGAYPRDIDGLVQLNPDLAEDVRQFGGCAGAAVLSILREHEEALVDFRRRVETAYRAAGLLGE